jgi:hypothetical protein
METNTDPEFTLRTPKSNSEKQKEITSEVQTPPADPHLRVVQLWLEAHARKINNVLRRSS